MSSTSKNWEDYASPWVKDTVKQILEDKNPYPGELEYAQQLIELCLNPDHCHVLATPLLVFSSISISAFPRRLERFFNAFGSVRDDIHVIVKVIDDDSNGFTLFDSDSCSAAHALFFHDGKLDISLENSKLNLPLWIPKFFELELILEDRFTRTKVLDHFRLNFDSKVVYDRQHCFDFHSRKYGRVLVHSAYFRYATFVSVHCRIQPIDDTSGTKDVPAHVGGVVSARFMVGDRLLTRVLLNPAMFDPAELCWSLSLAVPAYSVLEILVDNLWINQDKIDSSGRNLKFEPHYQYYETVEMVGQKWRFLVTVEWKHVYKALHPLCERDSDDDVGGSQGESIYFSEFEESDTETSEQSREKRPRLQGIEVPMSDVDMPMQRMDALPAPCLCPLELVEVFSISVCPYAGNVDSFSLCGTISFHDFFGEHEVFNGDKNKASLLYPHQTISMVGPHRCYMGLDFTMRLDLKDNQGRDMSHGYLAWCFVSAESWLDRRMCSVVRGKDGFAAVHYTMFGNATQARVAVYFESRDDHEFGQYQIYGKIQARYTGYKYSTQYDRNYYQSVLLHKGKADYVTLHGGDRVPLSKLVVAVPLDEALVVVANLRLIVGGRKEKLRGKVEFQAQEVGESLITPEAQSIEEGNYGLRVSVSWG